MSHKILLLPGDGIGPEIAAEAVRVLDALGDLGFDCEREQALIGGAAIDATGSPLPEETLRLARDSDAVLLAAVGGPQWDDGPQELRPERGLLGIRKELDLFANLRPATLFEELVDASSLKPELVAGLDLLIVRELTGGIYFGEPRGIEVLPDGRRRGFNTMHYDSDEVQRIARVAFGAAQKRSGHLCSVDKANVLAVSQMWRDVVNEVAQEYPDVTLTHMYVDNAAMQLVRAPKQFDVVVTGNLFGDILSDCAAMLTGSIGMLQSASLNAENRGMYEPVHGSAPDIAGQGIANPLATILSVAMMLRHTFDQGALAARVEDAVRQVLRQGLRTGDIHTPGTQLVGTEQMGRAVVSALRQD